MLDPVLAAVEGRDVSVLYANTVRPFDGRTLRAVLGPAEVVLVEPYLAGTSSRLVADVLGDVPHRLLGLGVRSEELRRYGTPEEHHGRARAGRGRAAGLGGPVPGAGSGGLSASRGPRAGRDRARSPDVRKGRTRPGGLRESCPVRSGPPREAVSA